MKKSFLCPLCNQNKAHQSSTYPDSIVCDCSGKLLEVATLDLETGLVKGVRAMSRDSQGAFVVDHISNKSEVIRLGRLFQNALGSDSGADMWMNHGCDIYLAAFNGDETNRKSFMFFVKNREAQNFRLYQNAEAPKEDQEIVKEILRSKNIIDN